MRERVTALFDVNAISFEHAGMREPRRLLTIRETDPAWRGGIVVIPRGAIVRIFAPDGTTKEQLEEMSRRAIASGAARCKVHGARDTTVLAAAESEQARPRGPREVVMELVAGSKNAKELETICDRLLSEQGL